MSENERPSVPAEEPRPSSAPRRTPPRFYRIVGDVMDKAEEAAKLVEETKEIAEQVLRQRRARKTA